MLLPRHSSGTNVPNGLQHCCPDYIIYFIFPNMSALPQTRTSPCHHRFCQFPCLSGVSIVYHYAFHCLCIHRNHVASCSNCAASAEVWGTIANYTDLLFLNFSLICALYRYRSYFFFRTVPSKMQSPADRANSRSDIQLSNACLVLGIYIPVNPLETE